MRNEELIPQADLNRAADLLKIATDLKKEILAVAESLKGIPNSPATSGGGGGGRKPQTSIDAAQKEVLRLSREELKVQAQIDAIISGQATKLTGLQAKKSQLLALERAIAKELATEEGTDARRSATLSRMTIQYKLINKETAEGLKLAEQMEKEMLDLNNTLLNSEMARGTHSRNVGNYASGFNTLGFQVQQVARELPSATVSLSQFFLAISNNVPMLLDRLSLARKELAEMNANGEKGVPIWKQLTRSIISWQTLLIVAITLITAYGKEIGEWFKGLFGAEKQLLSTAGAMKEVNKAMELSDFGKKRSDFEKLRDLYAQIGDNAKEKKKFLKDYRTEIDDTGISVKSLVEADNLFIKNSAAYINILKIRAQAQAAQGLAEKEFAKQFEAQVKADQKIAKRGLQEKFDYYNAMPGDTVIYQSGFNKETASERAEFYRVTMDRIRKEENAAAGLADTYHDLYKNLEIDAQNAAIAADFTPIKGDPSGASHPRLKALNDERKALEELTVAEIDMSMGVIRRTLALNQASVSERMAMTNDLYDLEEERIRKLAKTQEQNIIQRNIDENTTYNEDGTVKSTIDEVQARKNVANQLLALQYVTDEKIFESVNNRINATQGLENEAVDNAIRGANREMEARQRAIDEAESNELAVLSEKYSGVLSNQTEYEEERLKVTRKYAAARQDVELEALESQLAALKADPNIDETERQRIIDLEAEIAGLRVEINKTANDEIIDDNERLREKTEAQLMSIKDSFLDIFGSIVEGIGLSVKKELDAIEAQREAAEEAAEEEQERIERLAEHGAISEEQKNARIALSEQQLAEREKQLDLQKRQAQARQARWEQGLSLVQAIINGAVAVSKSFAELGPIAGAIAAVAVGAAVGVQIATITSTQIPQYAKGTPREGHPGGLAVWGDGGKAEMGIWGGKIYKSPSVPTVVDMPKEAVVFPDWNVAVKDMILANMLTPDHKFPGDMPRQNPYNDRQVRQLLGEIKDSATAGTREMLREMRRQTGGNRFKSIDNRSKTSKLN